MPSVVHGGDFNLEVLEERPGIAVVRVEGDGVVELFTGEAGGHRWQRIPPNEKRGRVHTSTVTVAVMSEPTEEECLISDGDIEITACRGSGAGGQKRNKTSNAIQILHRPTGLRVRCESERSQLQNRKSAMAVLRSRLQATVQGEVDAARAESRKGQVGSGMRGDKRRTIRCQDDQVHDHIDGRRWRLKDYLKGEW